MQEINKDNNNNEEEEEIGKQNEQIQTNSANINKEEDHYEHIMTEKVGFGIGQLKILFVVSVCWLLDAAELTIVGFIKPMLGNYWNLNYLEQGLIGSTVFAGWVLGNIVSMVISDKCGRKILIIINIYGVTITGLVSAFSQNLIQLLTMRTIIGFFIGIGGPSFSSLISEVCPMKNRAKYFILCGTLFPFGELFVIFIAYFNTDDLENGNWRNIIFYSAFIGFLAICFVHCFLIESPRYLLIHGKFKQAYENLEYLSQQNNQHGKEILGENDKMLLKEWRIKQIKQIQLHQEGGEEKPHFSLIFGKKIVVTTVELAFLWISLCFIYYGILFELPSILLELKRENEQSPQYNSKNQIFFNIAMQAVLEFPGGFAACFLVDLKYSGRKWTIFIAYFLITILCFIIIFKKEEYLTASIFVIKLVVAGLFLLVIQFTTEIYPTFIRGSGVSFQNLVCRVGGLIMPLLVSYFSQSLGAFSLFYICLAVTSVSTISSALISKDTANVPLDNYFQIENQQGGENQSLLMDAQSSAEKDENFYNQLQ